MKDPEKNWGTIDLLLVVESQDNHDPMDKLLIRRIKAIHWIIHVAQTLDNFIHWIKLDKVVIFWITLSETPPAQIIPYPWLRRPTELCQLQKVWLPSPCNHAFLFSSLVTVLVNLLLLTLKYSCRPTQHIHLA